MYKAATVAELRLLQAGARQTRLQGANETFDCVLKDFERFNELGLTAMEEAILKYGERSEGWCVDVREARCAKPVT